MKKIAYFNPYPDDGTSFYRITPLSYLKNKDISLTKLYFSGNITWEAFLGFDILFMERPSSNHDLSAIKLAKLCGLKIITDWDDDCLHIPLMNPMWHHYQQCKSVVMECLALSDEVWVSSVGLKSAFKMLNKNIHVIPNCHNDYIFPLAKKKPFNTKTNKAIWRGGGSHEADVYESADELISVINNNTNWQFQLIGCRFIYMELKCGDNYQPVSLLPLMNYFAYLQKENPNIVFHPLQNNRFNESKSNIVWLEASYAGAAFFGNVSLPEFSGIALKGMKEFVNGDWDITSLEIANQLSWELITDTLLLSNINKIREGRVLAL